MKQWTLWDLLTGKRAKPREKAPRAKPAPIKRKQPTRRPDTVLADPVPGVAPAAGARAVTMQERYDSMTRELLAAYGVRVRKWRSSMTGVAWEVYYEDGRTTRLIEAPRPRGPMSAAVFLHEIGHHAIGFHRYKPRCLEEHMAWQWALEEMRRRDLNITPAVERRVYLSMRYAISKATRRGIKALPAEMEPYLQPEMAAAHGVRPAALLESRA